MSDMSIDGPPATSAPFRIGVVLSKTFDLFTRQFGEFLLLSLVPMLPLLLLELAVLGRPTDSTPVVVLSTINALLTFFLSIVAQATTLYGAFQAMRGHPFTIGQSLQVGLGRALPVVAVALLVSLATGLAGLLLIVPGVIVYCMYYVAVPVCVIEQPGVTASMGCSAALTKGYRWSIFGLVALVATVSGVISGIPDLLGEGLLSVLLQFGWQTVTTAVGAVLVAVVYHDLRVAKEGIDIESLASVFD